MEYFVAGATARTAGSLVGVNFKTAVYYFHRLRDIEYRGTEDETPLLKWTRVILAASARADAGEVLPVKCLYWIF